MNYEYDDNKRVEPTWYVPIIPMSLVNGAEGIGTGWSTKIPNFNPREISANIRRLISKEDPKPLHPFYKNFNGQIDFVTENRYVSNGNIAILPNNKIEITELPIGIWTQTYKENVLEVLLNGSEKDKNKATVLSDYKEYHTDTTVRFVCTFAPGEFDKIYAEDGGFHRVFKLTSGISTSQMHCFDQNSCLRRFDNVNDILKEFFDVRMEYYQKRKDYLEGMLQANSDRLSDQARFILEKCNKTLVVENKQRKTMIDELIKRGYRPDPLKEWQRKIKIDADEENDEDEAEEEGARAGGVKKEKAKEIDPEKAFKQLTDVKKFDYLLGMSMWMLTEEKKNELLKQRDAKLEELKTLQAKTLNDLYIEDLDEFDTLLDEVEEKERQIESGVKKSSAVAAKARAKATAGLIKKRNTVGGSTDLVPDPKGVKVAFKISADLVKKMEKAVSDAKASKEKVVKKEKKTPGEEGADEFDNLVTGKKPPAAKKEKKEPAEKKEPKEKKPRKKKDDSDGMKQSKLDFSKGKKVCLFTYY